MQSIEALEASLQRGFDATTLAAYGRALRANGDPRGELVAADLAQAKTPDVAKRRAHALHAWLGPSLAGRRWNPRRFEYGFFDDYHAAFSERNEPYLRALFDSPVGPYLRGVTMVANQLGDELALLVERTRPWLRRLELNRFWSRAPSREWLDAFPQKTPNLEELHLWGAAAMRDRAMFTIGHPNVKRLVLDEESTSFAGGRFPAVTEVVVTKFDDDIVRHIPTVRVLEVRKPWTLYSVPKDIERLVLPAPRDTVAQRHAIELAQSGVAVELVRVERDALPVELPNVRRAATYPWPVLSQQAQQQTVTLTNTRRQTPKIYVTLADFVLAMRANFDELDAESQFVWREVWASIEGSHTIAAGTMATAAEALDDARFTGRLGYPPDLTESWGQLATKLRERCDANDELAMDVS